MTLKVLLINPWQGEVFPPPSLGYLQAALRTLPGVQTTGMELHEAMQTSEEFDIVAASFHSFSVQHARAIRQKFAGSHLVCGGHHPSALPQQMLDIGYDQVVIGEGEDAIKAIAQGERASIVQGAATDIEQTPHPDYTGFKYSGSMGLPIISSRGCPYNCSFCASAHFWHRRWRMRSAQAVLDEIFSIPGKVFMFEDDNFTLNADRVFEICEGLRGRGYYWQCASRAETLVNSDLCRAMLHAGCHTVWLGVESLSQASLDRNCKGTTVARMLHGIATAELMGLHTFSQFIIGLPDDTQEDIDETVRNIKRSRIRRRGCNQLWILPHTEAHRRAKAQGFDDETFLRSGAPFYTYEQNSQTQARWAAQINEA